MAGLNFTQWWDIGPATFNDDGTTRMERAAWRRIDGRWNISAKDDARAFGCRVNHRHG